MNDQISALKDDISFMRSLAEAGQGGPIGGGVFLVAAGGIYATACLAQWAGLHHLAGLTPTGTQWSLMAATAVWLVVWMSLVAAQKRSGRAKIAGAQRAFAVGWSAVGAGILANVAAVWIAAFKTGDYGLFNTLASSGLAFYGAAWLVCGAAARKRWMVITGAGSLALCVGLALLINDTAMLLGFAFALVAVLVLPGLYMMRQAAQA